jgi:hypothetical protein
VEIQPGFIVKLNVTTMNFKLKDITDSTVGDINVTIFNILVTMFEGTLKAMINLIFNKGVSMQWLLKLLHLDFVSLDESMLLPFNGYFVFYITPKFNITMAMDNLSSHFVQSVNSLFVEDELVITQEELNLITKNIDLSMKGGATIKETLNEAVQQVNYQKEKEYMS